MLVLPSLIGIVLVAMGIFAILFSYWQYRKTDQQLRSGTYQPSTVLTGVILLISVVLIVYLIQSVS